MLRKLRITLAIIFFALLTLLFLDFTGTLKCYLGWMAKIQFLPAVLAVNFAVVVGLIILTVLFGRVYCSIICPLGVMQDIMAWFGKKAKKNRYSYSPEKRWLRLGVLVLFIILFVIPGMSAIASIIAPYSTYGRIASNLFAPIYKAGNNILAYFAERAGSYSFYHVDVWVKGIAAFVVAVVMFVLLFVLAWRNGRTWCNTVCPVGTILGYIAKYPILGIRIDKDKCIKCGLCAKNCKSSCIDFENMTVDYSRCVSCFDCIGKCKKDAVSYGLIHKETIIEKTSEKKNDDTDKSRRAFITATATLAASSLIKAQDKKVDGGYAEIIDKTKPARTVRLTPPGASSLRQFSQHCTSCQLCVSVCPNDVLHSSDGIMTFMQPEMSYERGYCRPECVKCSEVCPTGAIKPITVEEKSSTQIGQAKFIAELCIVNKDNQSCGNCARHCPTGAIQMVPRDASDPNSLKIPAVNTERCIGCGACENLCPARPLSAIFVDGILQHKTI